MNVLRKTYNAGTSLVMTIPTEVIKLLQIKPGDYLEIPESSIIVHKKEDMDQGDEKAASKPVGDTS